MEFAHRILIVIQYHNIHPDIVPWRGLVEACSGQKAAIRMQRFVALAVLDIGTPVSVMPCIARRHALQLGADVGHAARDDHAPDL
ncbi:MULTISPECIES: hypothetical protein [unclassified Acidovorax]|uniref:hypothetical protein n=1 Tax=unclassified Acidovorax TaxID=2684926 RepID=UPI001B788D21|nr:MULTISPECIES: hypothetical protein [unclassified Acidovorax]MBP7882880.1 hypothetical protein [Acidovorax sp.]MBP7959916.1 hypothetical protein [Acidovorax sp.]